MKKEGRDGGKEEGEGGRKAIEKYTLNEKQEATKADI